MEKKISPLKAVRAKCLSCVSGSPKAVKECTTESCALHPFRMGKNPFRQKRVLTPEQIAAAKERFAKARAAKKA